MLTSRRLGHHPPIRTGSHGGPPLGGGGEGTSDVGEGGGFGVSARPVGAFVLRDGEATWKPAVDVTRIVVVCGLVAIAYLFFRWRIEKARSKAAEREARRRAQLAG